MLEAFWRQIPNPILFRYANLPGLIGYFANAGDRYTIHSLWQPAEVIGPNRKQQLEILAAMQRQH